MRRTLAVFGAVMLFASPASADGIPQSVKAACKNDYFKHCSMHEPGSAGVRDCMAGAFDKLSAGCSGAILNSKLADGYKNKSEKAGTAKVAKSRSGSKEKVAQRSKKGSRDVAAKTKSTRVAASGKSNRQYASAEGRSGPRYGKPRTVSGHIQRGMSIANFYVNRYARLW